MSTHRSINLTRKEGSDGESLDLSAHRGFIIRDAERNKYNGFGKKKERVMANTTLRVWLLIVLVLVVVNSLPQFNTVLLFGFRI